MNLALTPSDANRPGIASRVRAHGGEQHYPVCLRCRRELSEHTAPFDALVLTLTGSLALTIGGHEVRTTPQSMVLMPANVPHAVQPPEPSRMLLIMLRQRSRTRIVGRVPSSGRVLAVSLLRVPRRRVKATR